MDVVDVHPVQRRIVLSGTVEAFSTAFGVYLARYEHPDGTYRGRTGAVHVPEELTPIIEGVFGLDDQPQQTSPTHPGRICGLQPTHSRRDGLAQRGATAAEPPAPLLDVVVT
jgi:subtilase family serine protease